MNLTQDEVSVLWISYRSKPSDGTLKVNLRSSYQRFHTAKAAGRMDDGVYGMPMIPNFPVADAIIQPNILVQFTISSYRPLRNETRPKLEELRRSLKGDRDTHVLLSEIQACFHIQNSHTL